MQSAFSHDVHMLTIADPHRHLVPLQVPLISQILLRIVDVSNRTGIEYPRVTMGTCNCIKYTFFFSNNLVGFLVFKLLEEVALLVTISLAVEALDSGLYLGCPRWTSNTLVIPLWLPALLTLCQLARLLEVRSLVDHQHIVLLLDFHLRRFEHSKQL
jgi:hypothetical protein